MLPVSIITSTRGTIQHQNTNNFKLSMCVFLLWRYKGERTLTEGNTKLQELKYTLSFSGIIFLFLLFLDAKKPGFNISNLF